MSRTANTVKVFISHIIVNILLRSSGKIKMSEICLFSFKMSLNHSVNILPDNFQFTVSKMNFAPAGTINIIHFNLSCENFLVSKII